MCTLDYDDPVEVYCEGPRTARKEHTCIGCGVVIRAGEAYCYVSYVSDGSASSEKECFACWWTRAAFRDDHGAFPMPSFLWEELRDCIDGERSNPWRPHLAALERRWRTSSVGRQQLRQTVFRSALTRELRNTMRIVARRGTT